MATYNVQPGDVKHYIQCLPSISVMDIERMKQHVPATDGCNRRLLQQGTVLVTEKPAWVWEHAQIHFIGQQFSALLYAGAKTNKFICMLDGNDMTKCACVEEGWWLWFRNKRITVYEFIRDNASTLVGIGAIAIPAIAYRR